LACRDGGKANNELSRVFAERKQHTDLCHREAAEECRRYTELALQQQKAAADQQRLKDDKRRPAGAPC